MEQAALTRDWTAIQPHGGAQHGMQCCAGMAVGAREHGVETGLKALPVHGIEEGFDVALQRHGVTGTPSFVDDAPGGFNRMPEPVTVALGFKESI